MNLALLISASSLLIAATTFVINWRKSAGEVNAQQLDDVLDHVRAHYAQLNVASREAARAQWTGTLPILTKPGWLFTPPVPLASVNLTLLEPVEEDLELKRTLAKAARALPGIRGVRSFSSYTEALKKLDRLGSLYNGRIYRVLSVHTEARRLDLTFSTGSYFDHLNTSLVLTLEAAARHLAGRRNILTGRYRRWLHDPFEIHRRSPGLGVNTLTIRRSPGLSTFFLHRRDGSFVAEGPDIVHVIPAGEFTPSDIGLGAIRQDFDLWKNIMREYGEEFLNVEEAYGRGGRPIDYRREEPFHRLDEAYRRGELTVRVFGFGLDLLDWKPSLYTVAVIDAPAFDRLFAGMVPTGPEGTVIVGPEGHGIPFTEENIRLYADNPGTVNAGAVCLELAWRHREALGVAPSS
ncbi:hypothetical protein [Amycolatopsis kentuckyensis]|uniref:hypothetical protein n=1 Tax=Amycolatopsis kentuckyensis TaxID=218823 RepID=UPI000A39270D|nr:hypothetical protein [Amycolatopsis kentuckyensis]